MFVQKRLFCLLFGLFLIEKAAAQIVYGSTTNAIYSIDLGACTSTQICSAPPFNDMCIAPNGLFYGLNGANVVSVNPTNGATQTVATIAGGVANSLEWGQDGFLYALGNRLFQVSPTSGAVVLIGQLPAGWSAQGDLVYLDGEYYATVTTFPTSSLVKVNMTTPSASTIVSTLPGGTGLVAGASATDPDCPKLFWFSLSPAKCWAFDINSATWSTYCASLSQGYGGGDSPNDYAFDFSCCMANAGNVSPTVQNLCGPAATATVPYTGGAVIGAGQGLRYVLFKSLANPAGTTILQSATPVFSFNPATMMFGTPYFLGTVVGPLLPNGQVDLTASCLDFSNLFSTATWRALPSVSFSATDPNLCAGGCATVAATFSGTAPFSLNFQSSVAGPGAATFSSASGSFQICAPAGAAVGPFSVEATSLTDAFCVCD